MYITTYWTNLLKMNIWAVGHFCYPQCYNKSLCIKKNLPVVFGTHPQLYHEDQEALSRAVIPSFGNQTWPVPHSPATWPRASPSPSLGLSFLICKTEIIQTHLEGLLKCLHSIEWGLERHMPSLTDTWVPWEVQALTLGSSGPDSSLNSRARVCPQSDHRSMH